MSRAHLPVGSGGEHSGAMWWLAGVIPALTAGLVLGVLWSPARGEPAEVPRVLLGMWQSTADCPDGWRVELLAGAALTHGTEGRESCAYAGLRQITPTRWYLDLACPGGRLVDLDINALADGRLLVARRPLGEACFYARSGR